MWILHLLRLKAPIGTATLLAEPLSAGEIGALSLAQKIDRMLIVALADAIRSHRMESAHTAYQTAYRMAKTCNAKTVT